MRALIPLLLVVLGLPQALAEATSEASPAACIQTNYGRFTVTTWPKLARRRARIS